MAQKIKVEQEGLKVKVDFKTVWSFVWRYYAIVFGIGFAIGILVTMF